PELVVEELDIDEYPLLQAGDVFYLPVRAFTGENCFGWDVFYDNYSGLYISTKPGVSATAFFDKGEPDYNRGLVDYILSRNKNLSRGWATMLVFLFKHEADINGLDEILLIAMAEKESTFRCDAIGGGGAVGIMQIMPRTAAGYGISRNELFDPHVNIEFGAKYIGDKISQYNNNKTVALTAYNQGPVAVSRGSYSTRYANRITGAEKSITNYLVKNGYGLGE
ncbi:MAG: lytic transglycosylase domain-containing protein, partial [Bacillota bacterium]|nr:lytic transglycosylase domain-containing protein [Bacillota bacterium]